MTTGFYHQTVGAPFSNAKELVRLTFDFDKDGGAVAAYDLMTADGDLVILNAYANIKTAFTSGGSATMKVGITGNDDLLFGTTSGAVANLTLGAMIAPDVVEGTPNVVAFPAKLASGSKVIATIGTAAMTAGKMEVVLEVCKF